MAAQMFDARVASTHAMVLIQLVVAVWMLYSNPHSVFVMHALA